MMSQDQERIENQTSAANVATLMQNAGTKVAGKIVSDDKTARTISNAAGQEARANMVSLQRQDGLIGTPGSMVTTSISRWRTKSMCRT
jgi:intracellular multiplication protein IcmO